METKIELSPWGQSIKNFEVSTEMTKKKNKQVIIIMIAMIIEVIIVSFLKLGSTYITLIPPLGLIFLYFILWRKLIKKVPDKIELLLYGKMWLAWTLHKISLPIIKKGEKIFRNGNSMHLEYFSKKRGEMFNTSIILAVGGKFFIKDTNKKGVSKLIFTFESKGEPKEILICFAAEGVDLNSIKIFLEDCMKMEVFY